MTEKRPQRTRTQAERDAALSVAAGRGDAQVDMVIERLLKPDIFSQRALKRIKLFKDAKGREPTGLKQLKNWEASPEGLAAAAADLDNDG